MMAKHCLFSICQHSATRTEQARVNGVNKFTPPTLPHSVSETERKAVDYTRVTTTLRSLRHILWVVAPPLNSGVTPLVGHEHNLGDTVSGITGRRKKRREKEQELKPGGLRESST